MLARFVKYPLQFKIPAGTSRGTLHTKDTYFLIIENKGKIGIGECNLFKGLSADDRPDYEKKLQWVCDSLSKNDFMVLPKLVEFPSIQFGIEQAIIHWHQKISSICFPPILHAVTPLF